MECESSPSRGWQVGVSLQDRLYHMLNHEVDCDVTFSFSHAEPPTTIRAHKLVLKAGSPVFETMFSGKFAEPYSDVEIVDIVPTVFKEMLKLIVYLYTDTGNVTAENVLPLMFAAKKYIIDGLTALCTSFLTTELNGDNVCKILNDSLVYGVDSLAQSCCEFISPETESIIKTPGFRNMSHEALVLLLRYDGLVIENEILMYEACVAWARNQTGSSLDRDLRTKLGSCLHEIRFHAMKYDEFANNIGNAHDILNGEEKSRIYGYLISKSAATKEKLRSLGFNMNTRQVALIKIPCYQPDCPVQYGLDGNASETLTFSYTAGPRMLLRGVSIYAGKNEGDIHNLHVNLKVVRMDQSLIIQSVSTEGTITASANTLPVDFKLTKPQTLERGRKYILSLNSEGPSAYFKEGQQGNYNAGDMKFVFHIEGERGGSLALGQNQGIHQYQHGCFRSRPTQRRRNQRIAELILSQC